MKSRNKYKHVKIIKLKDLIYSKNKQNQKKQNLIIISILKKLYQNMKQISKEINIKKIRKLYIITVVKTVHQKQKQNS